MMKRALPILFFAGLILISFQAVPVHACDPDTGDVADCPLNIPENRSNPVLPNPTPNPYSSAPSIASNSSVAMPLACILPVDTDSSNALGVSNLCPAAPIRISPIKVATTPIPTPAPKVAAAVPTPKGDSPNSAKTLSDTMQTIEANGVQWYKVDNGQNYFLDIWLDANGQSGITFAVFSPEQTNGLSVDTIPKGRGAPVKFEPHDLMWKGANTLGVWYILVKNFNSTPVQYKIGSLQSSTDRICVGYWEQLGNGPFWWVDCGHSGVGGGK